MHEPQSFFFTCSCAAAHANYIPSPSLPPSPLPATVLPAPITRFTAHRA
jgi:hypothetical protein